jgi:tRNA dimethylallyltransferase
MTPAGEPLVVALSGPTGSGKSAWALQLIERLAHRMRVEIVSVDSAQVFRGMDIGTAKPDAATRARVPHHLIDIRDPAEKFSAGDFVREADGAIAGIHARGALPLLVGGTLLYLRALREGIAALPPADASVRAAIDSWAAAAGWGAVHAELARVDPGAAARIAPQDTQRLQRALEVYRLTGRPLSQWHAQQPGRARRDYRWVSYALMPESREDLRQRLRVRLAEMLQAGFLDEVRSLYARGDLTPNHASMRAVGYRQLWRHCAGELPLEAAVLQAGVASAQLAKRQLTWLRSETHWKAVRSSDVGALETLAEEISASGRA